MPGPKPSGRLSKRKRLISSILILSSTKPAVFWLAEPTNRAFLPVPALVGNVGSSCPSRSGYLALG